ncbi:hypothetical protein LguiA_004510 [Lonicera macranthoides]
MSLPFRSILNFTTFFFIDCFSENCKVRHPLSICKIHIPFSFSKLFEKDGCYLKLLI